jgi:hypothetical protein
MARVSKTLMPERGGGGRVEGSGWEPQRVEGSGAISSEELPPSRKILHRATNGVKLHRAIVVRGELAYRNKVLDKVWGNKNIIEANVIRKKCNASRGNWKKVPVTENDARERRGMGSERVRENIGIGGHVIGGTGIEVSITSLWLLEGHGLETGRERLLIPPWSSGWRAKEVWC